MTRLLQYKSLKNPGLPTVNNCYFFFPNTNHLMKFFTYLSDFCLVIFYVCLRPKIKVFLVKKIKSLHWALSLFRYTVLGFNMKYEFFLFKILFCSIDSFVMYTPNRKMCMCSQLISATLGHTFKKLIT